MDMDTETLVTLILIASLLRQTAPQIYNLNPSLIAGKFAAMLAPSPRKRLRSRRISAPKAIRKK